MSDRRIAAISRDHLDGVEVVHVQGEVDLTNAEDVQEAVERTATAAVVLDLTGVAYLDSSGIRAIDRSLRHLVSEQRSMFIVAPPDTPADWTFRVAGFRTDMLLASLDAALASAAAKARTP